MIRKLSPKFLAQNGIIYLNSWGYWENGKLIIVDSDEKRLRDIVWQSMVMTKR